MNVTARLLRVYRVDKQLVGLKSRLKAAERFLDEQTRLLTAAESTRSSIEKQLKQTKASILNHEGEMARLEARMAALREQMNSAQTNREYKAFLTEINTFKAEYDENQKAALELMATAEELEKQIAELNAARTDREKVKKVAEGDRAARAEEIRARVDELTAERAALAASVAPSDLAIYEQIFAAHGDEAMAAIEVQDFKRHEFTCGGCMMSVPIEHVSSLLSHGRVTRCPSCRCILYLEADLTERMQTPASKR